MSQDRWSIEKSKWDLLRFTFPLRDQEFGLLDMLPMVSCWRRPIIYLQ
jgi:hypothetical protein